MEYSQFDDQDNTSLTKFESMLKTNRVLFFDSNEFENIIHHYLDSGKVALAKKAIKLGLSQHPTSSNLKLFQIEIHIFEDELSVAENLLDKLHEIEPSNDEVYIQKANIFSKRNQHNDAIKTLKLALQLSEDNADIFSLIGMEYLFLEEFSEAILYFKKCLDIDNQDYSALYNVIYCFEYLEQIDEAIAYLNHYLNSNPYCEVAWQQLGKLYTDKKEFKKAVTAFDFAIISDDTFIGAYLEKGKVLEKLNNFEAAIENYKITLALDDPTAFALLRIGYCFKALKNHQKAIHYFSKAVEEDPMLAKAWIAITNHYYDAKDYLKALYNINKAISIDENNVDYWRLYAQINKELHFIEEAEYGFKKILELGNYELQSWLSRTDVLIQLGEYKAAINNLNQAIDFHPNTIEIEARLSGLYMMINDDNTGGAYLEKAMALKLDAYIIVENLFPEAFKKQSTQNIIAKFLKN